ncbi:MAG: glutamine--fructose-6-phosphate transaminase (isomerizing), partial [Deltaproteobacteria bacterium]
MCGIIGYLGPRPPVEVLLEGLRRLEYRGYDSAGIGVFDGSRIQIRRCEGKIQRLSELLRGLTFSGPVGIGHTRWATHGEPSERNAHPHSAGKVVLVHNGIVENYLPLKEALRAEGRVFRSETDTEIIAHLIDLELERGFGPEEAVRRALRRVEGSYALAIIFEGYPELLIGARKESPLLLGVGKGEYFLSSDAPAVIPWTRDLVFLEEGEMVVVTPKGFRVTDFEGRSLPKTPRRVDWSPAMAEKGGYKHFMLKEIHEQPSGVIDTLRGRILEEEGRVHLRDFPLSDKEVRDLERVTLVACGTSWHAALIGEYWIEALAGIPAEAEIASEFRYGELLGGPRTLLVAISQSGETADTLQAVREAKRKGFRTFGICNVLGSTLTRETEGTLFTHAGPEISVASTKAFTAQLAALMLLTLHLGATRGRLSGEEVRRHIKLLRTIPRLMEEVLKQESSIVELSRAYAEAQNFLYLGRGISYPVALEGALKLKEISYIHAEGYPAGEMKHGPIALIDEKMPTVVVAPRDRTYEKVMGNIKEIKSRRGRIIAVLNSRD